MDRTLVRTLIWCLAGLSLIVVHVCDGAMPSSFEVVMLRIAIIFCWARAWEIKYEGKGA